MPPPPCRRACGSRWDARWGWRTATNISPPPGLVSAVLLPGGDLAAALGAAAGGAVKVKVGLLFLSRLRVAPLYVAVVVTTAEVVEHAVSPQVGNWLVLANSTNVWNLQRHR